MVGDLLKFDDLTIDFLYKNSNYVHGQSIEIFQSTILSIHICFYQISFSFGTWFGV
jgi:hypothetical protein